jgi:flagellar hook-associated protein 3 FlgL
VEDPSTADVRGDEYQLARKAEEREPDEVRGVNLFNILRNLGIGLQTNDKEQIQNSLEPLDQALEQIVHARAKLGARSQNLQATMESIQKQNIDTKVLESNYEDADTFELFTDIKKAQTALDATLSTSGKIIQPSLLDFLK